MEIIQEASSSLVDCKTWIPLEQLEEIKRKVLSLKSIHNKLEARIATQRFVGGGIKDQPQPAVPAVANQVTQLHQDQKRFLQLEGLGKPAEAGRAKSYNSITFESNFGSITLSSDIFFLLTRFDQGKTNTQVCFEKYIFAQKHFHCIILSTDPSQIFFTLFFNWSPWKKMMNTDL